MADAMDSKSIDRKVVRVQVPPCPLEHFQAIIYNNFMKKNSKTPKEKAGNIAMELRRLGVGLENSNDKISLVAEMVGHLSGEVKIVKEDVGHLKEDVRHLSGEVKIVKENVGHLSREMETVKGNVAHLSKNMEIVKEDIEFIKSGFKKKVDIEEFSALERRVSILERHR